MEITNSFLMHIYRNILKFVLIVIDLITACVNSCFMLALLYKTNA